MRIVNKQLSAITPYENNPRKNDKAVEPVANSIREFGFRVPIVIDKGNVIVAGHTRYRAAVQLGLKEVPCVIADDLTEEQIRAFRLADNKTAEYAEWDFGLLNIELDDICSIDMSAFGFDYGSSEEKEPVQLEEVELEPYSKVHYLISIGINHHDLLLPHIEAIRKMGGVEIESTLN